MVQWFEVWKGTPKDLRLRMLALKTAGATLVSAILTGAAANYLISYTFTSQITPAQPQT